jgi:outer membrane receptor protein involved in Fe transport
LGTATVVVAPAAAQTTTGQVRGQVTDEAGTPVAGAQVVAVNTGTNQTFRATTNANGEYGLTGLRPGPYRVTITGGAGLTYEQVVIVAIGQSASLDATLTAAAAPGDETVAGGDDIVVTGSRLTETRTSEVATNVSQQQIRSLPQTDRNFLSFAALAPGVVYNDSETNKGISSGASTRSGVNVFIDGVSLKNQVLDGGVAGQQDSRGNPFGQLAVQEFRVLTQNYKAEYEQASAAIVTAVTKSGTNEFHGEIFGQYTSKELAETDFFVEQRGDPEPEFKRIQYGASLGGPIVKDKLFFFAAYEGNDQDRAFNVIAGGDAERQAAFEANSPRPISDFEGAFVSPFRGDFYFAKLTFAPDAAGTFDLSYSKRVETDIQGFGGATSFEAAEDKKNTVDTWNLKWTYVGDNFINEMGMNYLDYVYNPTSLNPNSPTYDYTGVLVYGGKDSSQRINQQAMTFRNDFTYTGLDAHTLKFGFKASVQDYTFDKLFFVQPRYTFIIDDRNTPQTTDDLDFSFPGEARLGSGDTQIAASNTQFGIYLQDDWEITNKLELNLGLRWDWESNMFNNEYVTPANAAATIRALRPTRYFNPDDYITDGTDRPSYKGMFQPRIGFSYDFNEDQRTVLFGGYGRYYDRNVFNNTLDEQYRLQYSVGTFFFSRDGLPRNGNPTVVWDDRYLTREGLEELRATAVTGLPELFAVKNNAKPPVTDQFSLGVRQKVGIFQASVTGTYILGRNGYTHLFATRNASNNECCDTTIPRSFGYANVLIGVDALDTRYYGAYFTLDKVYTESSGWGMNLSYTLSKAQQNGNDLFSLDKETPDDYGWRDKPGSERHRIVFSGIVDLPWDFRFSNLTTLGSGQAVTVTRGTDINNRSYETVYPDKNCLGVFAFCEVNFTLEKNFALFSGHELTLAADLFNAFNNKNFTSFDTLVTGEDAELTNPKLLLTLPRRLQLRASYRF